VDHEVARHRASVDQRQSSIQARTSDASPTDTQCGASASIQSSNSGVTTSDHSAEIAADGQTRATDVDVEDEQVVLPAP